MPNNARIMELALRGLQAERALLDAEIASLRSQLTGASPSVPVKAVVKSKKSKPGKMSAAARKAISDAMKRRWADRRKRGKA
jgi:hypothetical protein